MKRYNPKDIEPKWQSVWRESGLYKTDMARTNDKFYTIPMLPYPSGDIHIGHWYNFAPADSVARFRRMLGANVLSTNGFDAFGLPAENAAIKRAVAPAKWTRSNIQAMTKQIERIGASYDWSHSLSTCDPSFYRWNQWLFLKFYEKGLAYKSKAVVNWCPKDQTVLANEQVVGEDNVCERCGTPVIQKEMESWYFKITDYAERLLADLDKVDWPSKVKTMQQNWIGKSQGAMIDFPIADSQIKHFVLLHGKGGSAKTNFLPWLKTELESLGFSVEAPELPNSAEPNDDEQTEYVLKHCSLDEHTAVVGHSFGGIVGLRLLEKGQKLGSVTLVGTPFTADFLDGRPRPTVKAAVDKGFKFTDIKKNCPSFTALYDTGDYVVPMSDGKSFAEGLGIDLTQAQGSKGHFTGKIEPAVLDAVKLTIEVFTTRADTVYGATFMVVAPEHKILNKLSISAEAKKYIEQSKRKTELERKEGEKDKTGVFSGYHAINPATKEKIPIWIADYVLMGYGTGAIMAVPAHDERDWDFATKFELPIKQVVSELLSGVGEVEFRPGEKNVERNVAQCIVWHPTENKIIVLEVPAYKWQTLVMGGIDEKEEWVEGAKREIYEETGYKNAEFIGYAGQELWSEFWALHKNENRIAHFRGMQFKLKNLYKDEIDGDEADKHVIRWMDPTLALEQFKIPEPKYFLQSALSGNNFKPFEGEGKLINSGKFSSQDSASVRDKMAAEFGKEYTQYRLRDWLISRQRYWGTPIPIIYCDRCGTVPVPEKDLPVILPEDVEFTPAGRNPLLDRPDFVNARCPNCKGEARRETDTMDTFVDSSWYFLRYLDNDNNQAIFDPDLINKWAPVDHYIGGIEHAILHLLYARFITKFLHDEKLVNFDEPFKKLTNQGIILGPDGQKMSKSRGNVVSPDDQVNSYGADSLRLYLMFMGPYEQGGPYSLGGIAGTRRFLDRLWTLTGEFVEAPTHPLSNVDETALAATMHRAIKKVTQDLESLSFNTAIATLMAFVNDLYKLKSNSQLSQTPVWRTAIESTVQMLAPLAPHIAEELWAMLGHETSVHVSNWPIWDDKLVKDEMMTLAVQINGKVRSEIVVEAGISEAEALDAAKSDEKIAEHLKGGKITKEIYVPGRLVSFVVR